MIFETPYVCRFSFPVEMCSGPSVTGNCRAAFPRWYFDSDLQACRKFIYGGCGGSKNNHMSEDECADKCVGESR